MKQQGFSLLELSIVLVIIGLIAGGIVAGSSMIRAAELRAVITEHQRFHTAIYTFRDKYHGLPGDLKNATAFWGEVDPDPATCAATASTGTETCNGDGNGRVDYGASNVEWYPLWKQLSNAGLVSGEFSNIGSGGVFVVEVGVNAPASKMSGAGWMAFDYSFSHPNLSNSFLFGAQGATYVDQPIMTPEEAWNLDKKTDDGIARSGKIRSDGGGICHDTSATAPEPYDLTNKNVVCILIFNDRF